MTASFDPRRFKAQERAGFNRIAQRYGAGAKLRESLARAVVDAADLAPGQAVLDLASGPGLLARDALDVAGAGGRVVTSDLAEAMVATALHNEPRLLGCAADAEHLSFASHSFDRVLMGLGLFACPHPERVVAEIRRVLRPGGRVALSVWASADQVPLITRAQDCLARVLGPSRAGRPSVFRLGDPGTLANLLKSGGLGDIHVTPHRLSCHFPTPAAYWQAFLDLAGGVTEALARLPEPTRPALEQAVAVELEPHRDATGYRIEALTLVASASA